MKIYQRNLKDFLRDAAMNAGLRLSEEEKSLAFAAGCTVVTEAADQGVTSEDICAELARHPELKPLAASIRMNAVLVPRIMRQVQDLAQNPSDRSSERLLHIKNLVMWDATSSENLEALIGSARAFLADAEPK